MPKFPEPDEDNFRKAFDRNDDPRGEADDNVVSSSLSFGEKAAPCGLCRSSFDAGLAGFGLVPLPLKPACEGGVEPDENLELRLVIQEFLLPAIGRGALCLGMDFWDAGDVAS